MADGLNMKLKIDKNAMRFFQKEAPEKLTKARKNAVEAAGKVWADEAKLITRNDGHIVTGLYVNSIGYVTNIPSKKDGPKVTESDVIHEIEESRAKTVLKIGSNVAYAGHLEKHFNIMVNALDVSKDRMGKVAKAQVKKALFG